MAALTILFIAMINPVYPILAGILIFLSLKTSPKISTRTIWLAIAVLVVLALVHLVSGASGMTSDAVAVNDLAALIWCVIVGIPIIKLQIKADRASARLPQFSKEQLLAIDRAKSPWLPEE